jgi:SAM-dependent methyltransferase
MACRAGPRWTPPAAPAATPEMLAVARQKVPGADFREGDLSRLPLPGRCADVVVCALALTHVFDLAPVMAEFARVLRPGGHLVISNSSSDFPVVKLLPGGEYGYLPHRNHSVSDYLGAALAQGFQVRGCQEPRLPRPAVAPAGTPAPPALPEHPSDIWSLWPWCPAAVNACYRDAPAMILCHFQLGGR